MSIPITLATQDSYKATMPTRGTSGAAGYDLFAYLPTGEFKVAKGPIIRSSYKTDKMICEGYRALIPTGVKMVIPPGMYGRIAPRSGLAWSMGLDVMAGVIDSDYRGDIGVMLVNLGDQPMIIKHGERIAQIIFEQCASPTFEVNDTLETAVRGESGFGSTGV